MPPLSDEELMRLAIEQATVARDRDEVPIGCVIFHVPSGQVVGAGHNLRESQRDPTAHAEMIAIREATRHFPSWRLTDCTLAVTLEPCPMCAGAIVNARIPRLVYGCPDPKAGAVRTLYEICSDPRLNHRVEIMADVLADECGDLLRSFFRGKRTGG